MLSESETRELLRDVKRLRGRVQALERQGQPGARDVSWMGAVGMLQLFPGLVGLWPMSNTPSNGEATDLSGHGLHLTRNGDPLYNVDGLAPYVEFDGSGDYFSHADEGALDITGTEGHIASAIQGMTCGGWFYHDVLGSSEGHLSKWNSSTANRSYILFKHSSDVVFFQISSDGDSSGTQNVSSTSTLSAGTWTFVAARFTPSSELKVWVNSITEIETTDVPSSIFDGNQDFEVGSWAGGGNLIDGRAGLCFICAAAVPDSQIAAFYQYSKGLFA